MQSVIHRLHTDHENMLSMLDILESEFAKVEQAESANFDVMSDVMRYLTRYSDAVHHPMEDLVYARLADRSPKARRKLAPMPDEHERLEQQGDALQDAISQIADGSMALRSELVDTGQTYVRHLRRHIELEERFLFPMAKQYLDDDDLEEVERILAERKDPIFGDTNDADFRNLRERIRDEA